ncbi:hypothetical protein AHAS_Ahas01G0135900 [Arachis hypogaea]
MFFSIVFSSRFLQSQDQRARTPPSHRCQDNHVLVVVSLPPLPRNRISGQLSLDKRINSRIRRDALERIKALAIMLENGLKEQCTSQEAPDEMIDVVENTNEWT